MRASTYRDDVAPRDLCVLVDGRTQSEGTITGCQKHLNAVRGLCVNRDPLLAAVEVEAELLLGHILPDEMLYVGQIPSLASERHRELRRCTRANKGRGQQ